MSPSGLTPPMDWHFRLHLCPCPANSSGYFVTHHWWTVTRLKRGSPLQNENSCGFFFTLICSNPPTHSCVCICLWRSDAIRSRLLHRLPQHSTTVWEGFKVNGTILIGCTMYCNSCTWNRVRTCVEFVEAFTNERSDNRVLHRWHQTKAKSRETTKTEWCNNNQEPWLVNPKGPQPGNSWNLRSTMIQRKDGKGGYIYFTFVNLRSGKILVIILLLKKCLSLVASN